jgi:cytochrome c553
MLIAFFAPAAASTVAAQAAAPALQERLQACGGCHGADGNSVTPGIPSLAAQPRVFVENVLVLTREGLRGNAVMQALMKGITDREISALATHFAALPAKPAPGTPDKALVQKGKGLSAKLRCGTCHLPHLRGREQMPRLAGQREDVLYAKMIAFRDKPPPGTDTIMNATLYGVKDEEVKAMAHFLAHAR